MLTLLSIKNFVLIDKLEVSFVKGLTTLTGETGAGKSIILDALGLVLGDRSQGRVARNEVQDVQITAVFLIEKESPIFSKLEDAGIESLEDTLILRRVLSAHGRSRMFINDTPTSLNTVMALRPYLVEVHGQFDHLLTEQAYLECLDTYGQLNGLQARVAETYYDWKQQQKVLDTYQNTIAQAYANAHYINEALEELQALDPQTEEEEKLLQERGLLMNHNKIIQAVEESLQLLQGEPAAETLLSSALRALTRANLPEVHAIGQAAQGVQEALATVEESGRTLRTFLEELDTNPQRLEEVEERLHNLRRLARKHNCTPQELPAVMQALHQQQATLSTQEDQEATLQAQVTQARERYSKEVVTLSHARQQAALDLSAAVQAECGDLKLRHIIFQVVCYPKPESHWNQQGGESVTFMIATQPGAALQDMRHVASGGERARLILALRSVVAQARDVPLLIFDEVDQGVGGAVAHAVGSRLQRLAQAGQVFVITHSPQVAAMGQHHLLVEKHIQRDHWRTTVRPLDAVQREEEIARMLAGEVITDAARLAAQQLLALPKSA